MKEITGDCWAFAEEVGADAVCVLTNMTVKPNGELVMGGGQALQAAQRYPPLPEMFGNTYLARQGAGDTSGLIMVDTVASFQILVEALAQLDEAFKANGISVTDEDIDEARAEVVDSPYHLVSFPTKDRVSEDSKLPLIVQSATELMNLVEQMDWTIVVLPRPGCGLGGLDWDTQVKPALEPILDDRVIIITF